jgi:hypothetical protein
MACRFFTEATFEGMQGEGMHGKLRFGEQFISDLSAVIVLLMRVKPAESCAGAISAPSEPIEHAENADTEAAHRPAYPTSRSLMH